MHLITVAMITMMAKTQMTMGTKTGTVGDEEEGKVVSVVELEEGVEEAVAGGSRLLRPPGVGIGGCEFWGFGAMFEREREIERNDELVNWW